MAGGSGGADATGPADEKTTTGSTTAATAGDRTDDDDVVRAGALVSAVARCGEVSSSAVQLAAIGGGGCGF